MCTQQIQGAEAYVKELEEKVRAQQEQIAALETHIAASPGGALYLEAEGRWNETYHK